LSKRPKTLFLISNYPFTPSENHYRKCGFDRI